MFNTYKSISYLMHRYGFLFLVFIILIITCSETTILLCYFHLCAEVRRIYKLKFMLLGYVLCSRNQFVVFIYKCSCRSFDFSIVIGLSLVVAQFLDKWIHCVLPVRLLCALLCYQVGNRGSCFYIPLHWVHFSHGVPLFPRNR